jgi:transcriptional regulator with XRE-family HTH domain
MTTSLYATHILSSLEHPCVAISANERAFSERLGAHRGAAQAAGHYPVEMAKALGVSQQTINSCEFDRRRVPVSALSTLARTLGVSLEELLAEESAAAAKKRGTAPKLQQQMERIQHLPRAQQRFVMQVIDTVLAQQDR